MLEDWDDRARRNSLYYIATGNEAWELDEFFESGRQTIGQQVLTDMVNICGERQPSQMRVLEIGCGVGRLTRALSESFGEVHGVDVSSEMIQQARELLSDCKNVYFHCNNGSDLKILDDLQFHFAFSMLVFQHIPSKQIIENYFREVARVLLPGSLFKFQLVGCSGAKGSAGVDTWLGATFSEPEARALAQSSGFEMRYSYGAETSEFWLWFFKE